MILTFDKVHWFFSILRSFFASIDYVIYSLISWIMEGIFNLSNLMVDPAFVKTIYNRIYVIIAIFMVFKLSFSFLKYMMAPDSFNDKNEGVGKLIVRAITMVAILILLPVIFFNQDLVGEGRGPVLSVLQTGLIKTVPRIILGINSEAEDGSTSNSVIINADEYGNILAVNMLSSFFFPEECRKNENSDLCAQDTKYIDNLNDFLLKVNEHSLIEEGNYDYQYMWPLTTIAGVLLAIILIGMAIDIAIRTFKLIILQMMAPIPIMTYIDPKSSKDGAFNSWLKKFVSTYIDIFIKLATIYLLLLLVSKVFAGDGNGIFKGGINSVQGFMSRNFVRVFLVIGLFKFAKDAPQFIKDAMGIKGKSDSGFGFGKTLAAAGGALVGGVAGLAGGYAAAKEQGQNKGKAMLSALGSGASGMFRGGSSALSGAGKDGKIIKGISAAAKAQSDMNQRKMAAAAAGSTMLGRFKSQADTLFKGKDAAGRDEERLAKLEEEKSKYDRAASTKGNLYDYIMDKGAKNGASTVVAANHSNFGSLAMSYDKFNTAYQDAKQNGKSSFKISTADGHVVEMDTFSGDTAKFASDLQEASATQWARDNATDVRLKEYEADAGVENGKYYAAALKKDKKENEARSRETAADIFNLKTDKQYKANKADSKFSKKTGK